MFNNTQRHIQLTRKYYDHNPSLVWTHIPQIKKNHPKPNIASYSLKIFKHSDHNQALVFPTTLSSFLE